MTLKMKIIQIGNSLGVTLPKEALAALKVEKGDVLMLTEAPDGFRLTPYDPEIAKQIDAGGQHGFLEILGQGRLVSHRELKEHTIARKTAPEAIFISGPGGRDG